MNKAKESIAYGQLQIYVHNSCSYTNYTRSSSVSYSASSSFNTNLASLFRGTKKGNWDLINSGQ